LLRPCRTAFLNSLWGTQVRSRTLDNNTFLATAYDDSIPY
jgi:hypothetical protein